MTNQTEYRNQQRQARIDEYGCDPYSLPSFKETFTMKRSPSEELLDIFPPLNLVDLKRAYHKKAKIYHPDKTGGDHGKFLLIKEAYDELLLIC